MKIEQFSNGSLTDAIASLEALLTTLRAEVINRGGIQPPAQEISDAHVQAALDEYYRHTDQRTGMRAALERVLLAKKAEADAPPYPEHPYISREALAFLPNQKIQAIKTVREQHAIGLGDAKKVVDDFCSWWDRYGPQSPQSVPGGGMVGGHLTSAVPTQAVIPNTSIISFNGPIK